MSQTKLISASLTACGMLCGLLSAQEPQTQNGNAARLSAGDTPIYRLTLTERTVKAINYRRARFDERSISGAPSFSRMLAVRLKSRASKATSAIEAEFDGLQPATQNGAEYLTYVLWAVTPEGRTANLGEVLLDGTKSKLHVTTELQVFGLVVTAEPYYAVTQPSDLIVMENVVRPDTKGKIEEIDAKYELLQRGQYQRLANPLALTVRSEAAAGTLRSAQRGADRARRRCGPFCRRDVSEGSRQACLRPKPTRIATPAISL